MLFRSILVSAVKTALGKYSAVPSIDFSADPVPLHPLRAGDMPTAPRVEYRDDYNPFASQRQRADRPASNWERLYDAFRNGGRESELVDAPVPERSAETTMPPQDGDGQQLFAESAGVSEVAPLCMQYASKYIVTTTRDGLVIIDQHRAHVKILYEEYLQKIGKAEAISQTVMFPEPIELDESQQTALGEVMDELRRIGFTLEYEEGTTWRVTAVPAMLKNAEPRDVIMRILDSVTADSVNYGKEGNVASGLNERVALVMARSAAIRRGQKLPNMRQHQNILVDRV